MSAPRSPWFGVRPARRDRWATIALAVSAIIHTCIILLLLFGIPQGSQPAGHPSVSTAMALQHPLPKVAPTPKNQRAKPEPQREQQPPPPPPPPMKEVELGPKSNKPDAPAKEAAAKQAEPEKATPVPTQVPDPKPTPAPPQTEVPNATPTPNPAPQKRIQPPRLGDYTAVGAIPRQITSAWGPPKIDSASGSPPAETVRANPGSMGRSGLSAPDPSKWSNSFDDETSGQCPDIPDNGKNADGTPVLSSVLGQVFDERHHPMGGAHLQIVGSSFNTFSDANGEYRLTFDPKLLQKCRKQMVQVVAPGFATQYLTLMIGPRVRSDDVILRHH